MEDAHNIYLIFYCFKRHDFYTNYEDNRIL
ncbi:hypothetical protein SAMN06265218_11922 [Fodinibius sediminis]|uniref:Uncharacterized protein n=1 Tax=Fodinibius sediminis TaxID=1214077 RepID=A0A521EWX6_9BACT|nr:hypothetical protein SAMN06265218_11922 [Fodinibius sediminis]